jgi:alanine racemase
LQLGRFTDFVNEVRESYPRVIAHAANSAAVLREPASHFDLARCGVAVYGLDPFGRDPVDHGLEPALTLESHLGAIKRFEPGSSAGYGRTWRATESTWVGIVPIGYGDGWRRALSNRADALVGGRRRPLVGTVSMDNVAVELGPRTDAEVGDEVVLIGRQGSERILCEEVADRLETINYEVTCGLLPRVPRLHEAR